MIKVNDRIRVIRRFFAECTFEERLFLVAVLSMGIAGLVLAPIAIFRNL